MKKTNYQIDLKVYSTIWAHEIPVHIPSRFLYNPHGGMMIEEDMVRHGREGKLELRPGYKSILIELTEEELDQFEDWAAKQSEIKIIGTTPIN